MATGDVRIGIIGSGGIAGAHAERYKKIPGVRVVAVADVVPGRAESFIQRFGFEGAQAYTDHRKMLEQDFDGVSVCTFNAAHYQPTMDALAAGKHVLLEKPMATTLAEGVDMVRQAKRHDRMLSVGFQSRYEARNMTAKSLAESGALGHIYFAEVGGGRRRGIPGGTFVRKATAVGGAVLDIGCYSLDTAMWVLGDPRPLTVSAYTGNHFGSSPERARLASWDRNMDPSKFDVEDFGMAMVRLDGDTVLVFKISWAMHAESLGPTLFLGTKAGLNLDEMRLYHDLADRTAYTEINAGNTGWSDAFFRKIEVFVDAVRKGGPAPIPGAEMVHATAIIEAIYTSAAEGREVRIEIPEI